MDAAILDQTSETFLSQWRRLVSTSNWEKGRIISEWRAELARSGAPAADYSDDAWSRRVGAVTSQHVGRLRRAYERFGETKDSYDGLYWSHFQAALEWDDAEMWLEGAVQNEWTIAAMRAERTTTRGLVDDSPADEPEIWDEDAEPDDQPAALRETPDRVRSPEDATDRNDDEDDEPTDESADEWTDRGPDGELKLALAPFAELPSLPADVTEAFEAYKVSIVRHKLLGWTDISRDDLVASLDALKELALTPTE